MKDNPSFKGFKPYPDRGQNFLADQNYIKKIVDLINPAPHESIIEIGSGFGVLTMPLSKKAASIIAIEWDKRLAEYLREHLAHHHDNVKIIQGDIMELDLQKILYPYPPPFVVAGNLPYYIATPLIQKLLKEGGERIKRMIFMVQKEVANRIIAEPSTKAYGYLSLFIEYFSFAQILLNVPPSAFQPSPKVESTVISLEPRPFHPVAVKDERLLFRVIKSAFLHRRKTLINALRLDPFFKPEVIEKIFTDTGIRPDSRAENITLFDFASISNIVSP